jgi:phosphoglycolate phosphatase
VNTAADILAHARALLLDFDGPICSVFAGIPAHVVADQLRGILADGGHTHLPEAVATSYDPFDVFRYAATLGDDEARYVEAAFTAHEVEAIPTAAPTEGAHDLIRAWHETGRSLAVVSNNSATAIETYLDLYNLRRFVDFVSARTTADASRLKPSPHFLHQAVAALDVSPGECAFVGDSLSDIEAAHAANALSVGYANKSNKWEIFATAGADALTEVLTGLVSIA